MNTQGNSSILQPGCFVCIFGYMEMIHSHTSDGCSVIGAFGATPSVDIYPLNARFLVAQSLQFLLESGSKHCGKETNKFLFNWKKKFHLRRKVSLVRN